MKSHNMLTKMLKATKQIIQKPCHQPFFDEMLILNKNEGHITDSIKISTYVYQAFGKQSEEC